MPRIDLAEGKYAVLHDNGAGLRALRYNEPWRDLAGDGLVMAMTQEIAALRETLEALLNYTVACEGLLNAAPAEQVLAAQALLAPTLPKE